MITKNFIPNAIRTLFFKSHTSIKNSMSGFPKLIYILQGFKLGFGNFFSGHFIIDYTTSVPAINAGSTYEFNPFGLVPALTTVPASKNFLISLPLADQVITALGLLNGERLNLGFECNSEAAHKVLLFPRVCSFNAETKKINFSVEVLDLNAEALANFDASFSVSISKL